MKLADWFAVGFSVLLEGVGVVISAVFAMETFEHIREPALSLLCYAAGGFAFFVFAYGAVVVSDPASEDSVTWTMAPRVRRRCNEVCWFVAAIAGMLIVALLLGAGVVWLFSAIFGV
jgi:hypothetical protein